MCQYFIKCLQCWTIIYLRSSESQQGFKIVVECKHFSWVIVKQSCINSSTARFIEKRKKGMPKKIHMTICVVG